MEGASADQDQRFAEWYVWAKREVSTDSRVSLGVAQAAMEAIESGADEQAARTAARRSTAGFGLAFQSRIHPRQRAYAEWYDWARREIGGGRDRLHAAAAAAMQRLDGGADAGEAAAAARAAVGAMTPPPVAPSNPSVLMSTVAPPVPSGPVGPPMPAPPLPASPVPPPPAAAVPVAAPVPGPVLASGEPAPDAPRPAPFVGAPAPPYPAHPPHALPPPPEAPSHAYAGFWRRFAASLIDIVLLSIGFAVLVFVLGFIAIVGLLSSGQSGNDIGVNLAIYGTLLLIAFVLAWLYYAGLEGSAWQGTIGKRLLRLVVTDMYGRRIGFGRATGRYFSKIASGLTLLVGYLMVAFTGRKQALHDLMAGTLVVRQEHLGLVRAAPRPVQAQQAQAQQSA